MNDSEKKSKLTLFMQNFKEEGKKRKEKYI